MKLSVIEVEREGGRGDPEKEEGRNGLSGSETEMETSYRKKR